MTTLNTFADLKQADVKTVAMTHEGATAAQISDRLTLRRSVMSCLLWEDSFYESGQDIAARVQTLALGQPANVVAALAIEAREEMHLRHVPLLLLSCLARTGSGSRLVSETIARVIQRADEITELLAIHAKREGVAVSKIKPKISAQMKRGIAKAFDKFDEYQLAKYNRETPIKLRDALFLAHPKPGEVRDALYKRLIAGELQTPDTWEVALSAGSDKKETFERLIKERKLGYLALLRNLRNMEQAGVDEALVKAAILARKGGADRVLPFRYVAAARAAVSYEEALDAALIASIGEAPMLKGRTIVLVDVSGSMHVALSQHGDMTRIDAAAALASLIKSEEIEVWSFSDNLVRVPHRYGMGGIDAVRHSQSHGGTQLIAALHELKDRYCNRLIVISDEQAHWDWQNREVPKDLKMTAYMINVASFQHGVGYGDGWTHIDGWSDSVIRYIVAIEHEAESRT